MKTKIENILNFNRMPAGNVIVLLPIIFAAANLLRMITGSNLLYFVTMISAGMAGGVLVLCRQILYRDRIQAIVIAAVFMLFGACNLLFVGNVDAGSLITELMMFGMAFLLLSYPHNTRSGEITFYGFVLLYAVYWVLGIDPKEIMRSSNNYISVILLMAVFFYYTALERSGGKIDSVRKVLPAVLCVVMAGWARGRAGILAFGFLLAGIAVLYLCQAAAAKKVIAWGKKILTSGDRKKIAMVACGALVVVVVAILLLVKLGVFKFLLGKFITRGFNNIRPQLWGEYIAHSFSSIGNLLLGTPLEEVALANKFEGNLHNSFLQIHADHGLIVFLLMVYLLVVAVLYYKKKKMYVHLLVLGTFIIRGMFDKFISMQYGMLILAYFMLYPFVPRLLPRSNKNDPRKVGDSLENGK